MTVTTRRCVLGLAAVLALGLAPSRAARALEPEAARTLIRETLDEVLALVKSPADTATKAAELQAIMERRAAMAQLARFAAGRAWTEMTPDQQARYSAAFTRFVAGVYARRFQEYNGETIDISGVSDAGAKGVLVVTKVSQPGGQPVTVEWLVTDRGGPAQISDIVIEGVSLAVTQREQIGGMLSSRRGDVERLIADLAAA